MKPKHKLSLAGPSRCLAPEAILRVKKLVRGRLRIWTYGAREQPALGGICYSFSIRNDYDRNYMISFIIHIACSMYMNVTLGTPPSICAKVGV